MLFFKLYNWLKYKTLPSSFLFKNRLFIERDSKHRKIMNNFGLVFRNSKWSDYANNNVTLDFKNIYFKWFFIFIFIFVFLYLFFYLKFFNNFFFNSLTFFFWFAVDSLDYYLSFFLWSFTSFFSIIFSKAYFFINNSNQSNFKNSHLPKFNSQATHNLNNSNFNNLSKNDLNWILYSWLTSKNNYNNANLIEVLFDSKISKNFWNSNYDFFFNLYKSVFFLNLNNNNNFFYKNLFNDLKSNTNAKILFFFDNTKILNNYFNLIALFSFKNFAPSSFYLKNSLNNLNNSKWNLESFSIENFKNNSLIRNKFGNFFLNDLSFFELSKTFISNDNVFLFKNLMIKNSLNNSIDFSKWNRWLYRYSLLHRKSIKFSQKLTFTKKLMNSGFYNSSIFKKNLWNSVYFNSKQLNSSQITTFFDSYFNGFFNNQNLKFTNSLVSNSFLFNNKENFFFFKFFENSYFWHLKRFFFFNQLKNNSSFFKINLNTNKNFNKNVYFHTVNNIFFNFFIKNRTFNMQPLSISIIENDFLSLNTDLHFIDNDIYNTSIDLDLFSKENLNLLNNISLNSFFFFNFHQNNFKDLNLKNFFYDLKKNDLKSNKFFKSYFTNLTIYSKIDFFYFKDLFLFQFFNK